MPLKNDFGRCAIHSLGSLDRYDRSLDNARYAGRVTRLGDEPVGEILLFLDKGYISSLE
jgi:hypothetical protein